MTGNEREIEAKFYVRDLKEIEQRLRTLEARLIQSRVREVNLRFDNPSGDLEREGRVLRLRQDEKARMTYKDGSAAVGGAISRREIEFVVEDFDAARDFIQALGYQIAFVYEKYRTTYKYAEALEVMLDELPYGNFVEIEGEVSLLKPLARRLGLNWEKAIPASYHSLFNRLLGARNLRFRDLTFQNFQGLEITWGDLGVEPADTQ